jgi:hypothetical protein
MDIYSGDFDEMLYFLKDMKEKYNSELVALESELSGGLICWERNGKKEFLRAVREGEVYRRTSVRKDSEAMATLCRKKYLAAILARIENNLKVIERAEKQYRPMDFDELKKTLPQAYRMQPDKYFFPREIDGADMVLWQSDYMQSNYRPEERTNVTSRGLRVRSKGELVIAEMLYRYEIPFRYEVELEIERYTFVPDFQLLRPRDRKVWYWEHCGLPYNEEYMEKHNWKLSMYRREGIVPWDNLIVTYNDRQGNINMAIVESEIKNKLL